MNDYSDIINLPHHQSLKRSRMSLENRAAQFAPFAALTGYSDAINETARITSKKHEIDDARNDILNSKLQILNNLVKNNPLITVTYFILDKKKNGGKYMKITGNLKKIDLYNKILIFEDKTKILFNDIYEIDSEIFKDIIDNEF